MTARIRIVVAFAILFALAAHPLAHPLLKECPCTHEVALAASVRCDSSVLTLTADSTLPATNGDVEAPAILNTSPRGPPVI